MVCAAPGFQDLTELEWYATRIRIETKTGQLIALVPNIMQAKLFALVYRQVEAGLPVRIIILKGRQFGCSTWADALGYRFTYDLPHRNAMICAHDNDSSAELFRKVRIMREHMPEEERRPKRLSSKKEIEYLSPHNSKIAFQTAGKLNLGRSYTLHFAHCSEMAFWRNAAQTALSLMQAIPNEPGTVVIIESTANGVGGEYYNRWNDAVAHHERFPEDLNCYLPIFLSWLDFPEYRQQPPAGYQWGELDEDELALKALGAGQDQLYWRRIAIRDLCGGDPEHFKQEYPSTPEEAFLLSGRRAIDHRITDYHRSTVLPARRARLFWDKRYPSGVRLEFGEWRDWFWDVWKLPKASHDYVVGGDVAEGKVCDPEDPKSDPDWHGGLVMDRVELRFVAQLHCRMPPDEYGEELLKAAYYWNMAWGSPEINDAGIAALVAFRKARYVRTYYRDIPDDRAIDPGKRKHLGHRTTTGNRNQMIDDYLALCRPDPELGFVDKIIVHSTQLVGEEESFIVNKVGKREHAPGRHDDLIFGALICVQLHLRCHRTRTILVRGQRRRAQTRMEYADGIDPGIDLLLDPLHPDVERTR